MADLDRLRAAFSAALEAALRPAEPCPPAASLHAAWHAELPVAERLAVLDHVARCSTCAEVWPLAGRTPPALPSRRCRPPR
jgi:hypothetical protein